MELRRISTTPATALKVIVNEPEPDHPDAGFGMGGFFVFEPAGQDGDRHPCSAFAARVVMSDPELAQHFESIPPIAVDAHVGSEPAAEPIRTGRRSARRPSAPETATEPGPEPSGPINEREERD